MTQSVIIFFLDGVGLGKADPESNPFMHVELPTLQSLLGVSHLTRDAAGAMTGQGALLGLDAQLGVPGLPQSATGQTTILTGHNAPALLGRHDGPYPNPTLRALLAQDNFFQTLVQASHPVAYANAYPARFLARLARGTGRLSANTQAAVMAKLKLRNGEDLRRGEAIPALLSNEFWPEQDFALPTITPRQAGANLAALAQQHTLTFFEFWYSDFLGHRQDREQSQQMLGWLDDFVAGILAGPPSLLLISSDHGNFEDWTTSKHTTNPSLTILAGPGFEPLIPELHSLADIKPALLTYLRLEQD
jgi:hypothetical protein